MPQMDATLDFEKPIAELEKKLHDLRELSQQQGVDLKKEINALEKKVDDLVEETFSKLTPWQRVLISRHPNRPYTRDYIENLFPDFKELHGDRGFKDDPAIMGGIASWPPKSPRLRLKSQSTVGEPVMIIGHQKGRTTKQKMRRNFGMAKPEGYRKAMRLMKMAERLKIPVLTFVDTPGAYPGIETEERGQAQAIAESIQLMSGLNVPVFSVVVGEGGSGGALALAVADQIFMQEYSTYSVISPEGCASILWSDAKKAGLASEVLKMSAGDLRRLKVIDGIIPEPKGCAHRDWDETFRLMARELIEHFDPLIAENSKRAQAELKSIPKTKVGGTSKKSSTKLKTSSKKSTSKTRQVTLRLKRIEKFRNMGAQSLGRTKGHAK